MLLVPQSSLSPFTFSPQHVSSHEALAAVESNRFHNLIVFSPMAPNSEVNFSLALINVLGFCGRAHSVPMRFTRTVRLCSGNYTTI